MKPRSYDTIEPRPPEWLWAGRVPLRTMAVLVGQEGIGKGFLGADLVARITRGDLMPDGTESDAETGSVIMVTPEDDPNSAMAYRLRAAGADLTKVYDFTDNFMVSEEGIEALRGLIEEIGDVRLIWIDPLSAVSKVSLTSSNTRVRQAVVAPLEQIARDYDLAIVSIVHTTKNGSVAGSKAITEAARMVLMITRVYLADRDIRLIHIHKTNIGDDQLADIAYTVYGRWPNVRVEYFEAPDEAIAYDGRPTPLKDKILAVLRDAETPLRWREVWAKLAEGDEHLNIAPDPDLAEGSVRTSLTRLKGDPMSGVIQPTKGFWTTRPDDGPIIGLGPLPSSMDVDGLLREIRRDIDPPQ